jgi:Recombination endonuclease VII
MRRINPEAPLTPAQKYKRYYEKHRDEVLAKNAAYCKKNAKRVATRVRWNRYGTTAEKLEEKMTEQDNKCAICRNPFTKTPHIDHDHECCSTRKTCGGCNRGLLCDDCNLGLGRFKDSIEILTNAINYLGDYNGRRQFNSNR